jgi:hypothetical protein
MAKIKTLIILFLSSFLIGCATSQTDVSHIKPVPPERVYHSNFPENPANSGIVTIVRDSGAVGSLGKAYISINDQDVVALAPREKFEISLVPGNYVLTVRAFKSKTALLSRPRSASVLVESAKNYFFRVGYFDARLTN